MTLTFLQLKNASLLLIIMAGLTACQKTVPMQLDILRRQVLPDIPSASGIEMTNMGISVMGDDAAFLYQLDGDFNIISKMRVASQSPPDGSLRIPKADKPDFEGMAALPDGRLLLFGSGSVRPQRDSVAIVRPDKGEVALFSMAVYYDKIMATAQLPEGALNIEAAMVDEGMLYLFNRGENLVAHCPLDALLAHLLEGATCPDPSIQRVELPNLAGSKAGFSGAAPLPGSGLALFTASVEDTKNWVDDGEVGGSFIGVLSLKTDSTAPLRPDCLPIQSAEGNWRVKVESVAVTASPAPGTHRLLLVTDGDDGSSEIIEAVLKMEGK